MPRKPAKPPKLQADYIPGGKSPAATKPGKVQVRCLGPGAEHNFMSTDPTTNRVCYECRRRLIESNLGRYATETVTSHLIDEGSSAVMRYGQDRYH